MAKAWTRDEEILVFNLYCKIPFQKSNKNHPDVIRMAELIGRSPGAVNMKIGNFGSFDEHLKAKGITGLVNASKLDGEIFREFSENWDELAYQSELLTQRYAGGESAEQSDGKGMELPKGAERTITAKQRINQSFFRASVLASYGGACCITGLSNPELLVASHIKPWADSDECEKTNPKNGLCLNALHDRAFDRGLITIRKDYTLVVSDAITDVCTGQQVDAFFRKYANRKIRLPDKFLPDPLFLEYHNDVIFESRRSR